MFKNLSLFRFAITQAALSAAELSEALAVAAWQPCAPTQPLSVGWVPPRGHAHGPLVEPVDSDWMLRLQVEQRVLPAQAVKRRVQALADQVEEQTGRKPGKKALVDLKEQAIHEMLPTTLTRQSHVDVWLARDLGLLMVGSTSAPRLDEVCMLLIQAWQGLTIRNVQTQTAPATLMTQWLLDGPDYAGFGLGREMELKATDESKATVRYTRHSLDRAEIIDHIKAGKLATRLELDYRERVAFTLTDGLRLKRIEILDLAFEGRKQSGSDDQFDADVALACGEFRMLLPALIDALDGEVQS